MKTKQLLKQTLTLAVALLLSSASSHATLIHVDINTSALSILPASANAPFSLDLQFNDGGVLGNNTATISNFTYGGGGATGSATLLGGALGDIGSSVTFDNTSAFQEIYQSFTPGAALGFDVLLTQNVDGITPDSFVVAILDNNLLNIPTTGVGDSLLQADINTTSPLTVSQLNLSSGTGDYAGVSVAAVPEPSIVAMFGLGLTGMLTIMRRRRA